MVPAIQQPVLVIVCQVSVDKRVIAAFPVTLDFLHPDVEVKSIQLVEFDVVP